MEGFINGVRSRGTRLVVAKQTHASQAARELSVNVGDILEVLDDSNDEWWCVRTPSGQTGHVPYRCLEMLEGQMVGPVGRSVRRSRSKSPSEKKVANPRHGSTATHKLKRTSSPRTRDWLPDSSKTRSMRNGYSGGDDRYTHQSTSTRNAKARDINSQPSVAVVPSAPTQNSAVEPPPVHYVVTQPALAPAPQPQPIVIQMPIPIQQPQMNGSPYGMYSTMPRSTPNLMDPYYNPHRDYEGVSHHRRRSSHSPRKTSKHKRKKESSRRKKKSERSGNSSSSSSSSSSSRSSGSSRSSSSSSSSSNRGKGRSKSEKHSKSKKH
ncbi:hypothetical protein Aperf_G00000092470 [Anoplocephala perfoliata]